jgi:predicted phosphodiesterase
MRFIHAADLHIDSSLSGLRVRHDAAGHDFHLATRRAVTNMVAHAVSERVDLVVLAGDVFDGDWADYATGLFLLKALADLGRAGIPVVMIHGNHDASSRMTRSLTWPGHVRVLGSRKPETHVLDHLGVAVHGQSFPDGAVPGNLAAGYPPPVPGRFNIGLLHTSLAGNAGHDTYAPCSLGDLRSKGYDYWALGHVHTPTVVCEDPHVVYPGNIQGRHVNESGARGFVVVDVEEGRVSRLTTVAADALRWRRVRADLSGAVDFSDVAATVTSALARATADADGRAVAVRLGLHGGTAMHGEILSDRERLEAECDAAALQAGDVWLERIVVETTADASPGVAGVEAAGIAEILRAVAADLGERDAIRRGLEEGLGRLPLPLTRAAGVELADATFDAVLADASALLSHRLADPASGR